MLKLIEYHCMEVKLNNSKTLTIREAFPRDASDLLDYLDSIAEESDNLTFGPGEFDKSVEQEKAFLEANNLSTNNLYIIGTIDNKIIASGNISSGNRPRINHRGDLSISVKKRYWNMGIGRAMMIYLINWSEQSGIRKLNLEVRKDHGTAIHLYKDLGFKHEGITTRGLYVNNQFIDLAIMGLEIDS